MGKKKLFFHVKKGFDFTNPLTFKTSSNGLLDIDIINSGDILHWQPTINGEVLEQFEANSLSYDLSSNLGIANFIGADASLITYLSLNKDCKITELNISNLTELTDFKIYFSQGLTHDLDFSNNRKLVNVSVQATNRDYIDVSNQSNLQTLRLISNSANFTVDLRGCPDIRTIEPNNNKVLTTMLMGGMPELRVFSGAYASYVVNDLDFSTCTKMTSFKLLSCRMVNLNFDNCVSLTSFHLINDYIQNLDVSYMSNATFFYLKGDNLTNITGFENLTKLTSITLRPTSNISFFDFSNSVLATSINIQYTLNIETVDITGLTVLTTFIGNSNIASPPYTRCGLTALDTSTNAALQQLTLDESSVSSLDFSNNTALTNVNIFNTFLTDTQVDALLIQLDTNGAINGTFRYTTGLRTSASDLAVSNLQSKGWNIIEQTIT